MKALSIKQPWAWLIISGHKDTENRYWPTTYRGRIYVHASRTFDREGWIWLQSGWCAKGHDLDEIIKRLQIWHVMSEVEMPNGAIVGEVDIVDCVRASGSPWFAGPYGFVLRNPTQYASPIPYRGALRLFEVSLP